MKTYLSKTPIRVLALTVVFAMVAGLLPNIGGGGRSSGNYA